MNDQNLAVITGTLVMMTRYDIDGSKGGSCWLITSEDEENQDVLGQQIIKMTMPYEMFDQQKDKVNSNEYNLPCQAEVSYKMVMGSGNKPKLKAVSIRPLINNKAVETDNKVVKTTGGDKTTFGDKVTATTPKV
jgi:hypothetical protein